MADQNKFLFCDDKESFLYLKKRIVLALKFVSQYKWLIDAYISDFFVNKYWDKLLPCWKERLEKMSPPQHTVLLNYYNSESNNVLPLSMLSYLKCISATSLNRQPVDLEEETTELCVKTIIGGAKNSGTNVSWTEHQQDNTTDGKMMKMNDSQQITVKRQKLSPDLSQDLHNVFRCHVKPKKQHEISKLSLGVSLLCDISTCKNVVDVGAGLGHLSRILTFSKGLNVTTVEATGTHAPKAFRYDKEMEKNLNKVFKRNESCKLNKETVLTGDQNLPSHVVSTVSPDISPTQFVQLLQHDTKSITPDCGTIHHVEKQQTESASTRPDSDKLPQINDMDKRFILCGLHACGDLTATLLRMFVSCENTAGLASVGCCYMKLSSSSNNEIEDNSKDVGYPLSHFVKTLPDHELSYTAREMACHFIDSYTQRLKDDSEQLKVHCYRAAFQHIVTTLLPDFDRGRIKLTVKNTTNLTFEQYCAINLKKLKYNESIPSDLMRESKEYLNQWKNVMSFYTVRLSLSPVLETIILLDRMLYLYEQGFSSVLLPIFDATISPRNFLLLSHRTQSV